MADDSGFRFGEDRREGPAVRFEHPAPALHDVTDPDAGRVALFDPERVGSDTEAAHWLEIDARFAVSPEEAR